MSGEQRILNFGAGPAALPTNVLLEIQKEILNYKSSGRSIMELSHRSKLFEDLLFKAERDLRNILSIPNNYNVLFMQGGGTGQFAAVPLNLLGDSDKSDYLITGQWSKKAFQEAQKYGKPHIIFDTEKSNFTSVPPSSEWDIQDIKNSAYVYYCDNETINGIEFPEIPIIGYDSSVLAVDMSSNFLTREVDVSKYGLIFAGAQKNSGISGLSLVIVRDDLLGKAKKITPTIFNYKINSENKSLYNTPPTFSISVAALTYQGVVDHGGITEMEYLTRHKSSPVTPSTSLPTSRSLSRVARSPLPARWAPCLKTSPISLLTSKSSMAGRNFVQSFGSVSGRQSLPFVPALAKSLI